VFRKIVLKDKEALGILESSRTSPQSTLISVHRSRIIEVRSVVFVGVNKVKPAHTRYRALGLQLIPVYRQSARR